MQDKYFYENDLTKTFIPKKFSVFKKINSINQQNNFKLNKLKW